MFLGYYGDRVKLAGGKAKEFDWFGSVFGGSISGLQSAILDAYSEEMRDKGQLSCCDCCKKPMTLLARIHAPESLCPTSTPLSGLAAIADNSILSPTYKAPQGEDDSQIRVLIIACCNEQRCWKIGRASWKAWRWQPHVVITAEELKKIKDAKAAAYRKTLQTPVYDNEEDVASAKKTPSTTPTKSLFAMPQWSSPFGSSSFQSPASPIASSSASPASTGANQDLEELLRVRDLSISPQPAKPKDKVKPADSDPKAAASPQKAPQKQADTAIAAATGIESDIFAFAEAYIEFDKEPEIASYSGEFEVYEKKARETLSEGAEGTWAGEGYESSVAAKDKPFHRFHKRLQRAPEQCLRYWRGAEPLFCAANPPKYVPACECGAKRVPEVQLTPALIYLLQPANQKHQSNLDFGTVVIYTCSANCTGDAKPLHNEHCEMQKGM